MKVNQAAIRIFSDFGQRLTYMGLDTTNQRSSTQTFCSLLIIFCWLFHENGFPFQTLAKAQQTIQNGVDRKYHNNSVWHGAATETALAAKKYKKIKPTKFSHHHYQNTTVKIICSSEAASRGVSIGRTCPRPNNVSSKPLSLSFVLCPRSRSRSRSLSHRHPYPLTLFPVAVSVPRIGPPPSATKVLAQKHLDANSATRQMPHGNFVVLPRSRPTPSSHPPPSILRSPFSVLVVTRQIKMETKWDSREGHGHAVVFSFQEITQHSWAHRRKMYSRLKYI